jgi:hypothetical protein
MYEETRNYLAQNEGKTIKITGKKSKVLWQHSSTYIKSHPYQSYFDLKDGYQIIIYTTEEITCKGMLEVKGKVIRIKSIKDEASKANDLVEYHIIVNSWKCL